MPVCSKWVKSFQTTEQQARKQSDVATPSLVSEKSHYPENKDPAKKSFEEFELTRVRKNLFLRRGLVQFAFTSYLRKQGSCLNQYDVGAFHSTDSFPITSLGGGVGDR